MTELRLDQVYLYLINQSQKNQTTLFGSQKHTFPQKNYNWFSRQPKLHKLSCKSNTICPMLLTLYVFCFSGLVLKTKLIDKLVTQIHSGNFLLSFGDEYLVETLVSLLHRSIKFAYRASLILNQTLSYRQIQLFSMIWDYSSGFKYDICFRQIELQFGFFF